MKSQKDPPFGWTTLGPQVCCLTFSWGEGVARLCIFLRSSWNATPTLAINPGKLKFATGGRGASRHIWVWWKLQSQGDWAHTAENLNVCLRLLPFAQGGRLRDCRTPGHGRVRPYNITTGHEGAGLELAPESNPWRPMDFR